MLTGIDHIVVIVPDLETAVKNYTALGFTVVPGGRHPTGTHNALVGFQDTTYIELIAFYESAPDHRWHHFLANGGGLIDFCAATDNLASDLVTLREAGFVLSDPSPLSRTRPDGYKLDWVLALPDESQDGIVPFLIEDFTPRTERVPKENQHANGVTGIDTLTILVRDLPQVKGWYSAALKTPGQPVSRLDLDATGVRFTIGKHNFEFIAPSSAASPLNAILETRGPGIYSAALTTTGASGALDETTALHARFPLVHK